MPAITRTQGMAGRVIAGMACCVALAGSASAQTLAQTGSFLAERQWADAEASATLLLERTPDHADAQAMLGVARYHQGRFEESIPALQAAIARNTSYGPRALYYLGLAESKCGRAEQATDAFMQLLTLHPQSPEAKRLQGLSADITMPEERRSGMDLSGTVLSVEAGYDTNPDLVDSGDGDMLALLYAYSDLHLDRLPCLVGMSVFLEKYASLTENDFIELAVNLNDQFRLGPNGLADWSVEISQSLLDYEAFERSLSASFEYSQRWGEVWKGQLRAFGGLTDADDNAYDATRARLRIRAYRYMRSAGALKWVRLTAQTRMNDRDADWLAYSSVTAGADCRVEIPWDSSLDLGVRLESRGYGGEDPQTLETRKDNLFELSAFSATPIGKGTYVTGQATYTSRSSTDDFYAADECRLLVGALWVR